ncbi:MAG: hypothetical protein R6V58_07765, partial [Planctomycetota bacterium]
GVVLREPIYHYYIVLFFLVVTIFATQRLQDSHLERRRAGGYVRRVETNFAPTDVIRVAGERLQV